MNRGTLFKPSVMVLIAVNFIPLWGVLFRSWDVSHILHLYWAENVVVGVVTVLKILSNGGDSAGLPAKIFLSGFFTVHYGFFCFGHAMFVFGGLMADGPSFGFPGKSALAYLTSHKLLVLGFFLSHLFSYFVNYLGKGEFRTMNAGRVMMLPYGRIVLLHLTIIFGGMAVLALGSPVGLIAILVIGKIIGDLFFHTKEHKNAGVTRQLTPETL